MPADLPAPPGLTVTGVQRPNELVVHFRHPTDLRSAVQYWLAALPRQGFVLGTGDAEAEEADIPFSRGPLRGRLKLSVTGACTIDGLLALTP